MSAKREQAEREGMSPNHEQLHRIRGSVEVALDLVDRAATMYAQPSVGADQRILDELARAARALAAVSNAVDENFRTVPAA